MRGLTPSSLRIAALCGALALAGAAILVARGGSPVTPVSDTAVIESFTLYASRAQLLVGPYSRFGWHHPGPIYFYLIAPIYTLAGGSTPGLSAGALLINLASFACLAWVLVRAAGGWTALLIPASLAVYVWRFAPLLASPWNPHVVVLPLAALIVAAAAAASGHVALLPLAAALASFVMQTHLGVVPATVAILAVLAVMVWRAKAEEMPGRGRAAIAAAAVAAVCWAVPLGEELAASPGNMSALWRFFSANRGHQTLAASDAAWSDMVTAVVRPGARVADGTPFRRSRGRQARTLARYGLAALAVTALMARRGRRGFEAALAAMLLAALASAFAAVTRIHEAIIDHEVFWISAIGALAVGTVAAGIASAVGPCRVPRRLVAGTAAGACLTAVFAGFGALRAVTTATLDPGPASRAAGVIGEALERRVRATGVRPLIRIDEEAWPVAAGALLHLQRSRLPYAVEDDWLVMFTGRARATGAEADVIAIKAGPASKGDGSGGETLAAAESFHAVAAGLRPPR